MSEKITEEQFLEEEQKRLEQIARAPMSKTRHVPVRIEMHGSSVHFEGELLGTDSNGVMVMEDKRMYFVPYTAIFCVEYLKEKIGGI